MMRNNEKLGKCQQYFIYDFQQLQMVVARTPIIPFHTFGDFINFQFIKSSAVQF